MKEEYCDLGRLIYIFRDEHKNDFAVLHDSDPTMAFEEQILILIDLGLDYALGRY